MYESKMNVQRVCRKYRAIPRFCDFVTGSSQELFELFSDIKNLFFKTGYILQQCALANNISHFKMVMESVSCTDEDLNYQDPETGLKCSIDGAFRIFCVFFYLKICLLLFFYIKLFLRSFIFYICYCFRR